MLRRVSTSRVWASSALPFAGPLSIARKAAF
ncbi:hypothetical protein YPPY04_0493, partial [Yersinia pestis PY-04]